MKLIRFSAQTAVSFFHGLRHAAFPRVLIIFVLMLIFGCDFTRGGAESPPEEPQGGSILVESFRGVLEIRISWRGDVLADEYVLCRARDEIDGVGDYAEIYRGLETRYVDRGVEDNIRYVYRLDKVCGGILYEGEDTGIGVGSSAEVDMNEPNDLVEDATALSSFRRASMYYYRFSDGRELFDIDYYKVKVGGGASIYIQIQEDGSVGLTTLRMRFLGQESFIAEQGKWYELRNEAKGEREFYIELSAEKDRYVEPGLTGGMVLGYRIIRSDSMGSGLPEDPKDPEDPKEPKEPEDPKDTEDPKDNVIEERSEYFVSDGSGSYVFFVNEKHYQGVGYTFFKYLDRDWDADTGLTFDLVKESGHYLGGYGFFFAGDRESMLVILIQRDGNYAVGKVVKGNYYEITGWTSSIYLRKGYGVKNSVGVHLDSESFRYIITINGAEESRFTDDELPICTGSESGMAAVVTAMEQFPGTPVKVIYR
jgi:hypothetical protein